MRRPPARRYPSRLSSKRTTCRDVVALVEPDVAQDVQDLGQTSVVVRFAATGRRSPPGSHVRWRSHLAATPTCRRPAAPGRGLSHGWAPSRAPRTNQRRASPVRPRWNQKYQSAPTSSRPVSASCGSARLPQGPRQRRTKIVQVGLQRVSPLLLLRPSQRRTRHLAARRRKYATWARRASLSSPLASSCSIAYSRMVSSIANLGLVVERRLLQQAFVHQPGDDVQRGRPKGRTHRLDRRQRAGSREYRQAAEELLFVQGEEVVAPGDAGAHGPQTLRLIVRAVGQQREATLEAPEQGMRRQGP